MCLSEPDESLLRRLKKEEKENGEVDAWKVFYWGGGRGRRAKAIAPYQGVVHSPGQWYTNPSKMKIEYDKRRHGRYIAGFHAFLTQRDADRYKRRFVSPGFLYRVKRVKLRGVTVAGWHMAEGGIRAPAVVGQEMWIESKAL